MPPAAGLLKQGRRARGGEGPTFKREGRSLRTPYSLRADPDLHSEQIGRAVNDMLRRRLVQNAK